jgi:hypothetical protein
MQDIQLQIFDHDIITILQITGSAQYMREIPADRHQDRIWLIG